MDKELIIKALGSQEPFLTYDDKLYHMFDCIKIKPVVKTRNGKKIGLFAYEQIEYVAGFTFNFYYGGELQKTLETPCFYTTKDTFQIDDIAGIYEVDITYDN